MYPGLAQPWVCLGEFQTYSEDILSSVLDHCKGKLALEGGRLILEDWDGVGTAWQPGWEATESRAAL